MLPKDFTTYQAGVLQARAYRNLREFMVSHLKDYGYTMTEWSIIGLVHDYTSEGGLKVSQLAKLLDVDISLVTNMLNILEAKDLVKRIADDSDARSKRVISTRKSEADVRKIEKKLNNEMRDWLRNISPAELRNFIKTLQKLATK